MAGIEGKHQARKPSKASMLKEIYARPMKDGTGLAPRFINGEYRGERLHPDVERRIAEFRALPSYVPTPIVWEVVVGYASSKMEPALSADALEDIARGMA